MLKKILSIIFTLVVVDLSTSQEAILSSTEEYYDFLALNGEGERPYLNYRTLSDSVWAISEDSSLHVWKSQNLGSFLTISDKARLRIYGPELFTSYNAAAPYGQNDGLLWQGRGLNARLTGGARLEAYGFELTLKPEVAFSQNEYFKILPSAYSSPYGYIWGYSYNKGADAPQRFGDDPFYAFGWGDSEIRYTWKTLTVGFGTQSPWIGPGRINAIIHSNNAPPYPKIDFGLRRTSISFFGHELGDIETRIWLGKLTESDYFDDDETNDIFFISGFSGAYAPSLLPGLTLFVNRTYLATGKNDSMQNLQNLLFLKFNSSGGDDESDQRTSLGFSYLLTAAGCEVYGEAGINDNPGPSIQAYIKNFSHTVVYTGGLRKHFIIDFGKRLHSELLFEWSNLEMSQVYSQFRWSNSFYMHHQIVQGYTNEGQWIGAGNGTGGNSQYLGFNIYHNAGLLGFYIHRQNPDNDFLLRFTTPSVGYPSNDIYDTNFKAIMAFGLKTKNILTSNISLETNVAYVQIHDPLYDGGWVSNDIVHSCYVSFHVAVEI